MSDDVCGNCGTKIKETGFSYNPRYSADTLSIIQIAAPERSDACQKCSEDTFRTAIRQLHSEIAKAEAAAKAAIQTIPIFTIHSPAGWEYQPIGLITAQSTLGTGLFTDVASTFSDMFGRQSNSYNEKAQQGEELCKSALRLKAYEAGGNAVLAVDIDYTEMGGQKSLVMVCMSGTAVRAPEVFVGQDGNSEIRAEIPALLNKISELRALNAKAPDYV